MRNSLGVAKSHEFRGHAAQPPELSFLARPGEQLHPQAYPKDVRSRWRGLKMIEPAARMEPADALVIGANSGKNVPVVVPQAIRCASELSINTQASDHVADGGNVAEAGVYDAQHLAVSTPSVPVVRARPIGAIVPRNGLTRQTASLLHCID